MNSREDPPDPGEKRAAPPARSAARSLESAVSCLQHNGPDNLRQPVAGIQGFGEYEVRSVATSHAIVPTTEQRDIIGINLSGGIVAIICALAGTAKTTTLELIARANQRKRILYLTFSKAAATEAEGRFPRNTDCRTCHSLAYQAVGYKYRANPNKKLGLELRAKPLSYLLRCDTYTAQAVCDTVTQYAQSADIQLGPVHAPHYLPPSKRERVAELATTLWKRIIDVNDSQIPIPHDGYLKEWQLQVLTSDKLPPILGNYEVILVDEAQDLSAAYLGILCHIITLRQHALVLVGDEHQAIYAWRGAVNSIRRAQEYLEQATRPVILRTLTHSFRFGPRTAKIANRILYGENGEEHRITGRGIDKPDSKGSLCILGRTNAALMQEASNQLLANPALRINFAATTETSGWHPAGPYKYEFLKSLFYLSIGRPSMITDPEAKRFRTWNEVLELGRRDRNERGPVDLELASAIGLISKLGIGLLNTLDRIAQHSVSPTEADIVFSTVHRAKGLEWDRVTLLNDFPPLESANEEERNLIYVAVTRPRHWLTLNPDLKRVL